MQHSLAGEVHALNVYVSATKPLNGLMQLPLVIPEVLAWRSFSYQAAERAHATAI